MNFCRALRCLWHDLDRDFEAWQVAANEAVQLDNVNDYITSHVK